MSERSEKIARMLALYRFDSGKTYNEIAKDLHLSITSLTNKRKGKAPWMWDEVIELSEMTGFPISAFV